MTVASIRSSTNDASVRKADHTNYVTTHDAAVGEGVSSVAEIFVGQQFPFATFFYGIWRPVLYFDLSGLGTVIEVVSATLTITCRNDFSTTDFTIRLVDGSVAEDTLAVADYGDLLAMLTAIADTITTNTWAGTKTFTLNAAGIALLTGSTTNLKKLCLRSENDINSTAPAGSERVGFATADDATEADRPLLILTYVGGSTASSNVTTQAVSAIDKTTATGNGNVTGLGTPEATQHGHVWATFPNPTTSDDKTTNGVPAATGAYTSALTGLLANTLYYCRAYVTNAIGTIYGAEVTFTTLADVPAVTTNPATIVSGLTALGSGSIDNQGGSGVTAHGLCWSTSANPTVADSKTDLGATIQLYSFTSLMTGLLVSTTYHFRAYATNASGTGYGADVTFATNAIGAPTVSTQAVTNALPTIAMGNGTIVAIGGGTITQHGHCWSTTANPTTADSKTTNGAGVAGVFTSLITGLTAGTGYHTRAYATNAYGTGYGEDVEFNQVAGELRGVIKVVGEAFVYTSKTGVRRYIQGVEY